MLTDFTDEYLRYRLSAEKAIAQMPDDAALNRLPSPDGNSVAMLMRHMSGNLASRFTDFLSTDGEKPWRDRDDEFVERHYTRAELLEMWANGWGVLEATLGSMTDADLTSTVTIRGGPLTVHAALCRSLAHVATHVGQIVLLARASTTSWETLSIPRGGSSSYNKNPTREKRPS